MPVMPWPPVRADFADPIAPRRVSKDWLDWFQALADRTSRTPDRIARLRLTGQSAAIGITPLPTGALPSGLVRLWAYVRITQPAGTSSSLQLILHWSDGGVAMSRAGALLTTNTVQTFDTMVLMVRHDANAPLSYQTTYSSSGSPAMQYRLDLVAEGLF